MKQFSKEYIRFERKHLNKLEDLWYKTGDEELRKIILITREVLKRIYIEIN